MRGAGEAVLGTGQDPGCEASAAAREPARKRPNVVGRGACPPPCDPSGPSCPPVDTARFPGGDSAASRGRSLLGPIFSDQRGRERRGHVSGFPSGHSPQSDAGPGPVGRDLQPAVRQGAGGAEGSALQADPLQTRRAPRKGPPTRLTPFLPCLQPKLQGGRFYAVLPL
ncbi:hypothetical protein J1605_020787 [Eschrichtius robustus]|uniref:Uncharacterized protein n=1 Tax=Eschrichtius robustus TaxID=9764 RepID=A0AB34HE36_ESCRO|nr:hypothetical protein J1605_020787 [Eschrichtius robustus]